MADYLSLPNSYGSVIEEIELTGTYRGRQSYLWRILGNRTQFTNTTDFQDICEFLDANTNTFTPVTSIDVLEVVSSNVNDSSGGTGTRKVKITYLDIDGFLVESPEISLNGIVPVPVNFFASAILWMEATDGGSGEVSSGNISLRRVVIGTIFERIALGGNKSLSGRIRIPKGFTGYLLNWNASAVSQGFDVRLRATVTTLGRTLSTRFLFQDRIYLAAGDSGDENLDLMKFPEMSRIKVSGIPTNTINPRCDVGFSIILIAN